jgi:hypothetical protein
MDATALENKFQALCFYTLMHGGAAFIHQHVVDAYAVQTADENTKPIKVFFALAGLYLLHQKKYTGKQIQQAHITITRGSKEFPTFVLPAHRGSITVAQVQATSPGALRDEMIYTWCANVWQAVISLHPQIEQATLQHLNAS